MKKLFFGALVACAAATFVGCGNSTPKADLKTDVDTMSYAMGMSQTQGLKEFMVERMGVDTAYMDDFIKGLTMVPTLVMTRRRLLTTQVSRLVSRSATRWLRASTTRYSVRILQSLSL